MEEYDNETKFYNSTLETNGTDETDFSSAEISLAMHLLGSYAFLFLLAMILSLVTFLIALFSWLLIPKWRRFHNYVYLNLIACYTASFSYLFSSEDISIEGIIAYFFINSFAGWLFIASMNSYMKIVKVFSTTITRKVLKCTLFAYGIAFIKFILDVIDIFFYNSLSYVPSHNYVVVVLFLIINFGLYIRVLVSLCRLSGAARFKQKVQVATITFLMSGSLMLPSIILGVFGTMIAEFISAVLPLVQTIAISICFLMMKSNRKIWSEKCRCCRCCSKSNEMELMPVTRTTNSNR